MKQKQEKIDYQDKSFDECCEFFSKTGMPVILVDENNYIKYASARISELCGYTVKELINAKCGIICPKGPHRCPVLDDNIQRIEADATSLKAKNKTNVPVLKSAVPVIIEGKKYILEFVQNLTDLYIERKNMINADKLVTLSTLASGIAHDFNNILMVLKGNLDIVLSDEELGQDNIFLLNEIDKGIKRAALITGQMKNLSKCRKGKKTRLFLDDILKNIVEKALEQYDIDFTLETAKDLWPALVNITSFEHALECFIKNSVQAVQSAQGQIKKFLIEIRAENITVSKEVSRKKNIIPGEYVKISVSDFGPGIPIDQEDKIFTPYFTTKKSSIGLGLSMCEWIANDHCGYVFLEQNKALGKDKTVFSICLPVNVKESACSSEALGDAILKDKKNVLLMDDDQAVRTAVKIMLKRLDFEASGTCDGQSAIEAYKTAHVNKTPYDLVVLDLVVPGKMGGIEAAREIRRVDSKAKIIGMTGYSSEDMETNYSDYGFDAFLEKPFSLKDLEAAVSQIKAV